MILFLLTIILAITTALDTAPPSSRHEASSNIAWQPCNLDFGILQPLVNESQLDCATLSVPLDYTTPNTGMLTLQLMKRNATKKPVIGSVLFNPGGPGGSGLEDLGVSGELYNSILGGQFDLVTFDPRGTGHTIPFDCGLRDMKTSESLARRSLLPEQDLQELLFSKDWTAAGRFADECYARQNETGSFLSTAIAARDIMEIVDALNEDGMLRYWGLSYGTLLGATIAAMFPDRIDRMFLDSVVNPLDYMSGYGLADTADSGKTLLAFLSECVSAGPELCSIANFSGPSTTPEDLLSTMDTMFQHLLDEPLYLQDGAIYEYDAPVSVYQYLKRYIHGSLYSPRIWYIVPYMLELALGLNFTLFTGLEPGIANFTTYSKGYDAYQGIACLDASYRADAPEDMLWLLPAQKNVSSFNDIIAPQIWPCYQWRIPAAERYEGNFSASTSFPILIVNGQFDPITPLASAFNLSAGFEQSVVLQHTGYGHGFFSDPNLCVAKAVREYFVNGTMPAPGTICQREVPPFEIPRSGFYSGSYYDSLQRRGMDLNEDDMELLNLMNEVAERKSKLHLNRHLSIRTLA